jgi:hypothetical protein
VDGRNAVATSNDRYLISLLGQDLMRIRLTSLTVAVKYIFNWLPAHNADADPPLSKLSLNKVLAPMFLMILPDFLYDCTHGLKR